MHKPIQHHKAEELIGLIGMPGSGKTKVGKLVAKHLGCQFVDTDERIVSHFGEKSLQHVVDRLSPRAFAAAEEEVVIWTILSLSAPTVIATGGSVVYSEKAMAYLSERAHIIHLWAPLEILARRIAKHPDRGLVLAPGETLADLYERRMPLYERWENRRVETARRRPKVARRLAELLYQEGILRKAPIPSQ